MLLTRRWGRAREGLGPENRENRERENKRLPRRQGKLTRSPGDPTMLHEAAPKPKAHKRQAHPGPVTHPGNKGDFRVPTVGAADSWSVPPCPRNTGADADPFMDAAAVYLSSGHSRPPPPTFCHAVPHPVYLLPPRPGQGRLCCLHESSMQCHLPFQGVSAAQGPS